jgi:hypothetical protein
VLSLSLGGGAFPLSGNPIAVGTLAATRRDIVVSCSAGNSGPLPSSLVNTAPARPTATTRESNVSGEQEEDVTATARSRRDVQVLNGMSLRIKKDYKCISSATIMCIFISSNLSPTSPFQ